MRPKRPRTVKCWATGKIRYNTANDAAIALGLARSNIHRLERAHEVRYYLCPHCNKYHLTSRTRGE